MSKWYEVDVLISSTYLVEMEDDSEEDPGDVVMDELMSCNGDIEITDIIPVKEGRLEAAKMCAEEVIKL